MCSILSGLPKLCLNDLISASRIFSGEDRDLRALTRTRENYVKMRSQIKNRVHQELEYACIKLSSVISDIFGKSGIRIIRGLLKRGEHREHTETPYPRRASKPKEKRFERPSTLTSRPFKPVSSARCSIQLSQLAEILNLSIGRSSILCQESRKIWILPCRFLEWVPFLHRLFWLKSGTSRISRQASNWPLIAA